MRPLLRLAPILVFATFVGGCPTPSRPASRTTSASALGKGIAGSPQADTPKPTPETKEVGEPEKTEETPAPCLETAREADRAILQPIVAYAQEKGADLKEFVNVPWLSVKDLEDKKPEDLQKDTVVYLVTTEQGHTIVLFGPPWSEYGLQFNMAKSEAGEWRCTGHKELSGLEDFG